MIDITKPLQLSDGTPVKYVKQGMDGRDTCHIVTIAPGYVVSIPTFTYSAEAPMSFRTSDLVHVCSQLTLQNVPPQFDPTRPVMTRHGHKARIICTDRKHRDGPIMALVTYPEDSPYTGDEYTLSVMADGSWHPKAPNSPYDLINVPEQTKFYLNLFPKEDNNLILGQLRSKNLATPCHTEARTLEITVEDGRIAYVDLLPPVSS